MTLDELRAKLQERKEFCAKYSELTFEAKVGLSMPAPKYRPNIYPQRVRTPFGLCEWMPVYSKDIIHIFPTLKQVENYLKKAEANK